MITCTCSIWRRGMLGSSHYFQRLSASFVIPRRYLAGGRQVSKNEDAERDMTLSPLITRRNKWTSEEEGLIDQAIQGGLTWRQCVESLPGSTHPLLAIKWKFFTQKRKLRSQSGDLEPSEEVKLITKLANAGKSMSEIRMALPYLRQDSILKLAWYYGIKIERSTRVQGRRWSTSEDDIIRQESRNGVPDILSLVKLLPGIPPITLEWRAHFLRKAGDQVATAVIKRARWTPAEDERAISAYNRGVPLVKIAEMLSRTYKSIQQRFVRLKTKQIMVPDGSQPESKS